MISAKWLVLGAGPAGILALGRLLDADIASQDIIWLDTEFSVGDFGKYWSQVPGNTRVELFTKFLQSTKALAYEDCPSELSLKHLDPKANCLLNDMVKPLQWITHQLCQQVAHYPCQVQSLEYAEGGWRLNLESGQTIFAKNVILATGAIPKKLSHHANKNSLDLSIALNPIALKNHVTSQQHVAVFGASHSGVLAMKNLLDAGCRVTNFYQSPIKYALYQDDHIIYDNTGLKGLAASWAKEHLHGQKIPALMRYYLSDHTELASLLQSVDHLVYATGFSSRAIFSSQIDTQCYDAHTGIIAPGLFGLGIAYPEEVLDRYGIREYSVGLFKFANYLTKILPLWMRYTN